MQEEAKNYRWASWHGHSPLLQEQSQSLWIWNLGNHWAGESCIFVCLASWVSDTSIAIAWLINRCYSSGTSQWLWKEISGSWDFSNGMPGCRLHASASEGEHRWGGSLQSGQGALDTAICRLRLEVQAQAAPCLAINSGPVCPPALHPPSTISEQDPTLWQRQSDPLDTILLQQYTSTSYTFTIKMFAACCCL